ncbi:MAG: hypothetical protein DMF86_10840 [Acidobacteria bacterium]|nr:MAG: hypothetical protein DMF86_10840 [Acidobacteriota bacterium]
MRSYASFKGHPIHPALIPFPFAFLLGALLFDLLGLASDRRGLMLTGRHLSELGLLAGMVTAIPGVLDYLKTVPPASSGRARALRHGTANATALFLFAVGWLFRDATSPSALTIISELLGGAILVYGGWLGGTLVTRNLISVDHRYARAGKWQEVTLSGAAGASVVAARTEDLNEDQMKLLHIDGRRIVLARTKEGFAAFDDGCTHRGGSLAGGVCVGGVVQCLWHGSQFDTATGEVRCGPAKRNIHVYEVREQNGQVLVTLPRDG